MIMNVLITELQVCLIIHGVTESYRNTYKKDVHLFVREALECIWTQTELG